MLLAAEKVKETVTIKHGSINENITQCNSGFKNSYYSNFYNTKTTKIISEREKSHSNTIFNNTVSQKMYKHSKNTIYDKESLPEIKKAFEKKLLAKDKSNLSKNENFFSSNNSNRKESTKNSFKDRTFSNLKPKVKSNDSIPIKILKNIYTGPNSQRSDVNRTSFCSNFNINNNIAVL